MRKLASIQRITNLAPIPGADAIERADVLGWSVVVKKGEFAVGDLAVYHEIDSFLPASEPAYAFLMDKAHEYDGASGVRLRTIRLRKQLSQGLLVPIGAFAGLSRQTPCFEYKFDLSPLNEGDDVTELLGVRKWEPAEEKRSNSGGINKPPGTKGFPAFIRKTDQERVQNYINELGKHADETFEVTVKLDGSSCTFFYVDKSSPHFADIMRDQEVRMLRNMGFWKRLVWKVRKSFGLLTETPTAFTGVCSRNLQLDVNGPGHFAQVYRELDMKDRLGAYLGETGLSYAIQGELIGPSIQGNHENVTDLEFYVFDIFDIDRQEYLLPAVARGVCANLGLNYVPVLSTGMGLGLFAEELEPTEAGRRRFGSLQGRALVDAILAYAEGPGMNKGVKREGVVFKSNETPFSFKAISNSYLLKKGSK